MKKLYTIEHEGQLYVSLQEYLELGEGLEQYKARFENDEGVYYISGRKFVPVEMLDQLEMEVSQLEDKIESLEAEVRMNIQMQSITDGDLDECPFKITYSDDTVHINGDFRSGTFFESLTLELLEYLMRTPNSTLDLSEVIFMDSDTMRFVRLLEDRVPVILKEGSHVADRYKDYKDGKDAQEV